jgi:hypothetical protein
VETLEGRIIGRNLYEWSLGGAGVGCSGHTTVVVDCEDVTSSAGAHILCATAQPRARTTLQYCWTTLVSDRHVVTKLPRPGDPVEASKPSLVPSLGFLGFPRYLLDHPQR